MERYCRAGQVADDNRIGRMRIAGCIPWATSTHTECVILIALHCNSGYTNASQFNVIHTYIYIACVVGVTPRSGGRPPKQVAQNIVPETCSTSLYTFCMCQWVVFNRLTPNDPYMGRTTPLTSKRCILYIYSTNVGTEYFKHALYSPFFLFKMQFVS